MRSIKLDNDIITSIRLHGRLLLSILGLMVLSFSLTGMPQTDKMDKLCDLIVCHDGEQVSVIIKDLTQTKVTYLLCDQTNNEVLH